MTRRRRRLRLVLFAVVILGLGWFGLRALVSPPSVELLLAELNDRLSEELGLTLEIGGAVVSPESARVVLSPVLVRDADGTTLFSAQRIEAELSPWKLFDQRIQLRTLYVDAPAVHVRLDAQGRVKGLTLPNKAEPLRSGTPLFKLDVFDFRMTAGSVRVDMDEVGTVKLREISARLRESGNEGHRVKVSVGDGVFTHRRGEVELDRFGAKLVVFGDGLLAPERIDIADVTLKSGLNRVHVGGSVVAERYDVLPAMELDVYGTAMLNELAGALGAPIPMTGEVAATAHVSVEAAVQNLAVRGRGEVRDLSADGFWLGDLRGGFIADETEATFTDGVWRFAETEMVCAGALHFDDTLSFDFTGGGEGMSMYALLENLQIRGAWADVRLGGDVEGRGQLRPSFVVQGRGRGVFTDLQVASRDVRRAADSDTVLRNADPIAVDASFFSDLHALRLDGFIDDGRTHAEGQVVLNYLLKDGFLIEAKDAEGDFTSVQNRVGSLPLEGKGRFDLKVAGPYTDPQITAHVEGQDVRIDGFPVADRGRTDVGYRNARVEFSDIVATKNKTQLSGHTVLDWLAKRPRFVIRDAEGAPLAVPREMPTTGLAIDSHFVVERGRAEDLRAMIPPRFTEGVLGFFRPLDVAGPLRAEVRVGGHIQGGTTDHLVGGGDVSWTRGLTVLGQPLDAGHTTVRLTPDRVDIAGLSTEVAGGTVRADLRIRRDDGDTSGTLTADTLLLADIAVLADTSKPFAGEADADFTLRGPIDNVIVDGPLRLRGVRYGDLPVGDATLRVAHRDRRASLNGPVLSTRGTGAFTVETRAPYGYTAALTAKEGPLRPLLPPDTLPDNVTVVLKGRAESSGTLSAFAQSRGSVALDVLRVVADQSALVQQRPVLLHFAGDRVEVDQLTWVTERDDRVQITGHVTSERADLQVLADGDLWTLRPFVSSIERASGRIRARIGLQGPWSRAQLTGQATLTNAEIKFGAFDPVARHVDATLVFQNGAVVVQQAKGSLDAAPFRLRGDVKMRGLAPERYNLAMAFTDLRLRVPEWLPTRSSGEVTLRGPAALPTLGGEVELLSAVYEEDVDVGELLPEFRRRARTINTYHPDDEDLRYNLHLVSDGGIAVRNNVADINAKGDLYLVGTDERPGLRGSLVLDGGTARFRQNQFRFTQGTVEFADSTEITPILNVDAETRVRDYDITAHFDGPMRDLRVSFSSRPELQEIDVLALLTFGFTQLELEDTTVSAGAAGLEVVSAYTGLDEEVRRILPKAVREGGVLTVDELRLTSMFSTRQQSNVPAVRVGFEVNPGWWGLDGSKLRLSSTLLDQGGQGADQRIEWEKRFDNNMRLRLTWNSQDKAACPQCTNQYGDVGGDLWYRWEF